MLGRNGTAYYLAPREPKLPYTCVVSERTKSSTERPLRAVVTPRKNRVPVVNRVRAYGFAKEALFDINISTRLTLTLADRPRLNRRDIEGRDVPHAPFALLIARPRISDDLYPFEFLHFFLAFAICSFSAFVRWWLFRACVRARPEVA